MLSGNSEHNENMNSEHNNSEINPCLLTGIIIGFIGGFALSIWVAGEVLAPALERTHGINEEGSQALAILIWYTAGLPAFVAGSSVTCGLTMSLLGYGVEGVRNVASFAGTNSNRFFNRFNSATRVEEASSNTPSIV